VTGAGGGTGNNAEMVWYERRGEESRGEGVCSKLL
jgi:hypothetical protein